MVVDKKILLWMGMAVCFAYGFYWRDMFEDGFFLFSALSFFILSFYVYLTDRNSFICYLWACYSLNNLIDELIGTPTTIGINEKLIIVLTPIVWVIIRIWEHGRQNTE